jgi:hypothetical protein
MLSHEPAVPRTDAPAATIRQHEIDAFARILRLRLTPEAMSLLLRLLADAPTLLLIALRDPDIA